MRSAAPRQAYQVGPRRGQAGHDAGCCDHWAHDDCSDRPPGLAEIARSAPHAGARRSAGALRSDAPAEAARDRVMSDVTGGPAVVRAAT